MNKFTKLALPIVFSTIATTANAGLISGTHEFQNGFGQTQQVDLQGLEWLSLDSTFGLARLDIENQVWTDKAGTTWQADDWRYATRQETNTLLNSLSANLRDGWSVSNYQGADWFADNFGMIDYTRDEFNFAQRAWFNYGDTFECSANEGRTCQGLIEVAAEAHVSHVINFGSSYNFVTNRESSSLFDPNQHTGIGFIAEKYGAEFGLQSGAFTSTTNEEHFRVANLLVRNAPVDVPEPAPLSLLAGALVALGIMRKRKAR
ncbi:PEP-CTERM sorting domain-containing protein [Thalassotalea euphylliae]|uniref:PEP-CTERM sorting domain-containing protein n=1 Tax=Thalassotalea euphylliae TaxID=1655234 RepID=A0A3E0TX81_9GAMM|nr:PEP-CTERM sorting domain-containing protein [Thalassotalea euphylliae]REL28512.1 PEP-CTERM sorting domain-containing protein [Thalassotalea euphylliae]